MREKLLLLLLLMLFAYGASAQKVITGQVTDENNDPIAGAIIRVKDFTNATMSDFNGNYSIKVPEGAKVLIFSYTGKETQELEISGDKMNVQLVPSDIQVTTVVVTGLGIKRDEKKVGYAVTTVGGEDVIKARNTSAFSALSGKVAGVNITTASGAPGASTRVIFRGFTSLSGNNQPLYVVDGIPISNLASGSTSLNGGTDFGNQANDINPDDIESISFLKGSAATAIYGNRAASGVIVITTKSGKNTKKGLEVTFNSSVQFSTPLRLPMLQNVYGQGIYGNWDQRENTSYGPKFDGKLRYWGHVVDNQRLIKPYVGLENNVRDFFEVGKYFMNSISLAGGTNEATYRLSFSSTDNDGIMPFDKDWYNRNTIAFNGSTKLTNKISSEASINYVNKKNRFVPTGQGGQSVWNNVLQQPRDIPIMELADINNKFHNNDNYYSPYTTNPFWPLLKNGNFNNEDRMYGSVSIKYEFSPRLNAMFRVGDDISNRQLKEWRAYKVNDPKGFNADVDNEIGYVRVYHRMANLLNTDFIVTYVNNFGDLNISLLAGHNLVQNKYFSSSSYGAGLTIKEFYNLSNIYGTPYVSEYTELYRLIGVYGNLELGYKTWFTLTATARNDWSSALPPQNNSFFYPGLAIGFVFTDAFPFFSNIKKIFPYGKIRVSYGKTGKDTDPYNVYATLFKPSRFPLPNSVLAYSLGNLQANENLTPELTTEYEIGTDLRFFNGRYKIDFTYYNKTTNNLIFYIEKAPSTGYSYQMSNLGDIQNRGIEILVTGNVLAKKNIDVNLSWNFAINRSEVISLGDLKKYDLQGLLGSTETYFRVYPRNDSLGKPGTPIGIFELTKPYVWVDENGVSHPVVNNQGIPMKDPSEYYIHGTSQHDYITGFSAEITLFEILSISSTFDYRKGGWLYSRTAGMVYFTGISPNTLYNDRQPFIVPNSVFQTGTTSDGKPIFSENVYPVLYDNLGGSANSYWDLGGTLVGGHEMVPRTFLKWRDLAVTLIVPKKLLKRTPFGFMSVGLVGNNLMLWTPKENNIIDPELTTFGNDLEAEFGEFGATPSVRTIGFSLTLKF